MGMFDYIRCEVPLPDGFTGELQSKNFGCHLVTHVVTKEGRLLLCRIDKTENVTEAEANDPDVFWSPTGSFRMHTSLHDSNFQGVVRFYGCEGDHRDGTWQWHDYNAKFVDGQLVTIECNMRRTD